MRLVGGTIAIHQNVVLDSVGMFWSILVADGLSVSGNPRLTVADVDKLREHLGLAEPGTTPGG